MLIHQGDQVAKKFEIVEDKEWGKEVWSPPLKVMQDAGLLLCSECTLNARTNDDLVSILSEDPPGETVTLVVSKTDPIALLFIR